jgi:hypothetical protein
MAHQVYNSITQETLRELTLLLEQLTNTRDCLTESIIQARPEINCTQFQLQCAHVLLDNIRNIVEETKVVLKDAHHTEQDYFKIFKKDQIRTYANIYGLGQFTQAVDNLWETICLYFNIDEHGDVLVSQVHSGDPFLYLQILRQCEEAQANSDVIHFGITSTQPQDNYLPPAAL